MKIISWNTNGLRATAKQGFFSPLFEKYKPDIVCLQETKATPEQLPEEARNVKNYYSFFSHPKEKKGYSGVAIYSKEKPREVFYGMGIKKFDDEGRLVGAKFKNFTLINGYYPNGGQGPHRLKYKLEFYEAFLKFILKLRKNGENVIFCGDINTAHTAIDLARPKANEENTGFLPIERAWITKVIKNNFLDVWRELNPNKKDIYTYWDMKTGARARNVGWRIDYFFADKKLMLGSPKHGEGGLRIKNAGTIQNYMGSDHCPIWLELQNSSQV
ncbi:exodeoxyribonuclease III [Candidatus Nomurabacteria bacterium RIFCSPHIGHO2_01_FULL_37_25]|uniref:Exodeoxyribonuclease III n=1 Tax=Candidatus Nomurabacteria bacterium RIFCSPLOWO2_01_FULL_36_16 TaxID=1801767 RepID=A0A1F6WZD7_9BACT|nr:MAG: exodeoxyribonuclease III [Candidatus Nomurabacteria bacterium RIFCSPHIGHO2_01_FULL_37_25]OGI75397.1 MAG: exodeoxyribonuclease III [Candidatus Nomurabacteria bacterium RIFCSPHIGHO2_02_FULL_36_29]OGI87144.1 MAG: exodeoxyribonuclease III [Candidatus Nomurabacteria bacterium RIFCSPLOWO2_01_FULL_36_16]